MTILVTNDDGISSPGLLALRQALMEVDTTIVVAPDQVFDGAQIQVRWRVTNLGVGETDHEGWTDTVWLTRSRKRPHPDKGDIPGDIVLGTFGHSGSLVVGDSYDQQVTVTLPANLSGQYFITPQTDSSDIVTEETFSSNINPDDPALQFRRDQLSAKIGGHFFDCDAPGQFVNRHAGLRDCPKIRTLCSQTVFQ